MGEKDFDSAGVDLRWGTFEVGDVADCCGDAFDVEGVLDIDEI